MKYDVYIIEGIDIDRYIHIHIRTLLGFDHKIFHNIFSV